MSSHYKLRITAERTPKSLDEILDFLCSRQITFAFGTEGGRDDGPALHYHFYLITDIKEATLRKYLRETVGTGVSKGNSVFSLGLLDSGESEFSVEYLAYMIKEGKVYQSPDFKSSWLTQAQAEDARIKDEMKAKRKLKRPQLEMVIEAMLEVWNTTTTNDKGETILVNPQTKESLSPSSLLPWLIKWFAEKGTLFREFQVISIAQTVLLKYDPAYPGILQQRLLSRIIDS